MRQTSTPGDVSPPPFSATTKQILRAAWENTRTRTSTSVAVRSTDLLLALLQHSDAPSLISSLPTQLANLLASAGEANPTPEDSISWSRLTFRPPDDSPTRSSEGCGTDDPPYPSPLQALDRNLWTTHPMNYPAQRRVLARNKWSSQRSGTTRNLTTISPRVARQSSWPLLRRSTSCSTPCSKSASAQTSASSPPRHPRRQHPRRRRSRGARRVRVPGQRARSPRRRRSAGGHSSPRAARVPRERGPARSCAHHRRVIHRFP